MFELYPKQQEAFDAGLNDMKTKNRILFSCPTGWGKTILMSHFIKHYLEKVEWLRILVLAHRTKLIKQTGEKLLKVWPESEDIIGYYSASSGFPKDPTKRITIASIQSIAKHIAELQPYHVTLIDEAHKIAPANKKSQYTTTIQVLESHYKHHRLMAFSATPWRLGHGYIYGENKKPENDNWFDDLAYQASLKDAIEWGLLAPFRLLSVDSNIQKDLKRLSVRGDYVEKELSGVMTQRRHIKAAVDAVQKYAKDRKHIAVFAVTIDHARKLREAFMEAGYKAEAVHSKQKKDKRNNTLDAFDAGTIDVLISIGTLSEGWDSPHVDCIVDARPTKASALWQQHLGRGLRSHDGKDDCLILDIVGNWHEHESLYEPKVVIPGKTGGQATRPTKDCPNCKNVIHSATIKCKSALPNGDICNHEFPIQVIEIIDNMELYEMTSARTPAPQHFPIGHVMMVDFVSKQGNQMVKIVYDNAAKYGSPEAIMEFVSFGGEVSFLNHKGMKLWNDYAKTELPKTNAEAVERQSELINNLPSSMSIVKDGKYFRIHSYHVAPWVKQDYDGEKNNSILPIF